VTVVQDCTSADVTAVVDAAIEAAIARVHVGQLSTVELGRVRRYTRMRLGADHACAVALKAVADGAVVGVALAEHVEMLFGGGSEGVIHSIHVPNAPGAEWTAAALFEALAERGRLLGWQFLHVRIPHRPGPALSALHAHPEWTQSAVTICKLLSEPPSGVRSIEGLEIRRATTEDDPHLIEFYTWAYIDALAPEERERFDWEEVKGGAARTLAHYRSRPHLIIIAELDGEVIGHSTVLMDAPHPFLGRKECVLHDTFVLHEHRIKGIARVLTAHAERHVTRAGGELMRGTACGPDSEELDTLLGHLSRAGWLPNDRLWLRPLTR